MLPLFWDMYVTILELAGFEYFYLNTPDQAFSVTAKGLDRA